MTCKGDGNPRPHYKWFREENTRTILSSTNLYIIEDVVQNNSDVYICEVYNTIDDIKYNENFSVEIDIGELVSFSELYNNIGILAGKHFICVFSVDSS